jgi:hypothetical protein
MFPHGYFTAGYFAPGYFPPVVSTIPPAVIGSYPGPTSSNRRLKIQSLELKSFRNIKEEKRKKKKKQRQEEEALLFWLSQEED